MKYIRMIFVYLPLIGTVFVHSLEAQDEGGLVLRIASAFVSRDLVGQKVSIDPRVFVKAQMGTQKGAFAIHPTSRLQQVAIDGVADVVSLSRAVQCDSASRPECKTNGFAAFVMYSAPVIKRDSASVSAFVRVARNTNSKDSAMVRNAVRSARSTRVPDSTWLLQRLTRPHYTLYAIELVRANGVWRVVASRVVGSGS